MGEEDPPRLTRYIQILPTIAILQLLACHTTAYLGCEIDRPRNLGKSEIVK